MKQIVLRSPVVLYETVEALYQHVNGLSVEGRKRDLLQKFGSKLTRTEREQIEQSCALAAKVAEAACTGLEDGPALETFFRKWETESKWQNTCLAKLMIFSFLDIRTTDLEQSLQRTRQSAEERLNGSYLLRDINSGGISFYAAEPGQPIPPLSEQLDGLMIEEQYRWRLYKLLTNYSAMFDELSALLRSGCRIFCRGSCRSCSRSTTTGSSILRNTPFRSCWSDLRTRACSWPKWTPISTSASWQAAT